ncbi:MAG: methionine--tRNA ligase [Desulfovibrio sp.]|nr:MAG: methionine--tRNA ligase [Desulfovibrio sp.]
MKPFYITTPIYYVNAKPHLGHAYTTIVADCMARFHRALNQDVRFLTGTDEHGDKIVQAAEASESTPQAYVDVISGLFKELWPRLGITNSDFIRTTDERHKKCVQEVLQKVYDSGDIYFGEYGGHYCYGCERFYTEKELENGLCPQHQKAPEFIEEKNYFFRMSKHQDWLIEHIKANPNYIRPKRYRTEVLSLLESGALEDLCISRPKSRLTWGVELPFDTDYVCYVWFDALLNYISALVWNQETPDAKFDRYWPAAQHLVAKDILKPHAVFWPTMLRAAGFPPYQHLNVHGYWLVKDTKMSKSLGNVVEPLDMAGKYGLAAFRYFLLREMHFGNDASFSEEGLVARLNADLANDLGNLFNRALSMTHKYFQGKVPEPGKPGDTENEVQDLAATAVENYCRCFDNVDFSRGLEALWELIRGLNKYIDVSAPWTLFKNKDMASLGTVMYTVLEGMRKAAACLWPVMPEASAAMLVQLGCIETPESLDPASLDLEREQTLWGLLVPGTEVAKKSNLFPRVDLAAQEAEAEKARDKAPKEKAITKDKKPAANPEDPGVAEFADFQKLDLRVGTVTLVERHPNADKLLRVLVDLGEDEPRQVIAGLAEFFEPQDLTGRQVVVVANLAPRKLRGLESRGMILAVRTESGMQLLTTSDTVANGGKVS